MRVALEQIEEARAKQAHQRDEREDDSPGALGEARTDTGGLLPPPLRPTRAVQVLGAKPWEVMGSEMPSDGD